MKNYNSEIIDNLYTDILGVNLFIKNFNGYYYPIDENGFILSNEIFDRLCRIIKKTYRYLDNEQIINFNKATENYRNQNEQTLQKMSSNEGYIYFIQCDKYIKIGKTIDINKRFEMIKIAMPFHCKLIHSIKSNDIDLCEKYYHNKFIDKRTNGEWFKLTDNDIKFIKEIKRKNF